MGFVIISMDLMKMDLIKMVMIYIDLIKMGYKYGLNKYGYKKSSGKGLNINSLPILLSKYIKRTNK